MATKPKTKLAAKPTSHSPRPSRPVDPTGRLDIAAEKLAMHGLGLLGTFVGMPLLADALQPAVHSLVRAGVPRRKMTPQELEHIKAMGDTALRVVVMPHGSGR